MDKYYRVEKPKNEDPINESEIRVTTQGKMRNYISYASTLFATPESKNEVTLKAMGRAINKAVTIAEILKRRVSGLHQITHVDSTDITDVWEALEEGLDRIETTRHVSSITITLSLKELDTSAPGYQPPLATEKIKPFTQPRPKVSHEEGQTEQVGGETVPETSAAVDENGGDYHDNNNNPRRGGRGGNSRGFRGGRGGRGFRGGRGGRGFRGGFRGGFHDAGLEVVGYSIQPEHQQPPPQMMQPPFDPQVQQQQDSHPYPTGGFRGNFRGGRGGNRGGGGSFNQEHPPRGGFRGGNRGGNRGGRGGRGGPQRGRGGDAQQ